MFSVLKFIWIVFKAFPALLNVDRNALANVPSPTKYLAMILLSCFWCLAFGLYIGELLTIGYNMLGHVAIVTMVFVTWYVFRSLNHTNARGADWLRMPDYSSRCDELTDEQRRANATRADQLLMNK
jgi:hypothetical protein